MKEQFRQEFFNYLDSSIRVTTDKEDSIFFIYDKQLIRDRRINSILNESNKLDHINFKDFKDSVVFEHSLKSQLLFVNHNIWVRLQSDLSINYEQVVKLIKEFLIEYDESLYKMTDPLVRTGCSDVRFNSKELIPFSLKL